MLNMNNYKKLQLSHLTNIARLRKFVFCKGPDTQNCLRQPLGPDTQNCLRQPLGLDTQNCLRQPLLEAFKFPRRVRRKDTLAFPFN